MPKKNKTKITLEQIMLNQPREVEVEGYGVVMVRDPTKEDRIVARQEAMESPVWDSLSTDVQDMQVMHRVMVKIVVEPEITNATFLAGKETVIRDIIDSVLLDYTKRLRSITDKRSKTIKGFLDLMQAKNL